mmetsp:Transcript_751/g.1399  ORF Transcript_751/g.1399 Transcript_751/m.1399 type:complete len:349 (-) Transcript_751:294-1340(-)
MDVARRNMPPLELLTQSPSLELLERAAVHLPSRLARHGDALGAAASVLTLKVALLAVCMLHVVKVVLLKLRGVNGLIAADLLLPPSHRLLKAEAAILEEGAKLQPPCMLQVLLGVALLLHQPSHAWREGAWQEVLEAGKGELLPGLLGRGPLRQKQLHACLLQLPQEQAHTRVRQGHVESLHGCVQARRKCLLEALGNDKLQERRGDERLSPLQHNSPTRDQCRRNLCEGHLVEGLLVLGLPSSKRAVPPNLCPGRAFLQLREGCTARLRLKPLHVEPCRLHEGLLGFRVQALKSQDKQALLLPEEPFASFVRFAEGQAQGKVRNRVPTLEFGLLQEEAIDLVRSGIA